jgi:hypothetical protein
LLTVEVTPALPLAPTPALKPTEVPEPTWLFQAGLTLVRKSVKA